MDHNLEKYMEVAVGLTKEVGALIREKIWLTKQSIVTKANRVDFVTETDQQVEKLLITGLNSSFPDHKFMGEETVSSGVKAELTNAPTWIIDPVDGTLNFVHGYPNVCVSIGLTINKVVVLGIIYAPVLEMLFTAITGKGAFLNDKPIHVSNTKELKDALIALELSAAAANQSLRANLIGTIQKLIPIVHGIRSAGSAAYNMAMVALGGADCYFEAGIHSWDIAGGSIIVTEAGGCVMSTNGSPLDIMSRKILCASSPELAKEILPFIVDVKFTRDDE